ncbi:aldo/keto reductase [Cellulomonas sp. NS3]|uniref:aldo/keto reductase n=1 Tax=Cellulomonas sp. NS3 TaxID=2973977 RepID=UPI002162A5E2|nr:aldo/keto reductase [Cellulomonas sp. NS3]
MTTSAPTQPPVPDVALLDGTAVPQLGLGVYKVDDEGARDAVATALAAGYRLVDTARLYGNEVGVGRALRESGIPREELHVTTKVWNDDQGRERTLRAFDASVARLDVGPPDLYLIHWPCAGRGLYVETWQTLVGLREDGRVRSIGVSNFQPAHLTRIIEDSGVVPVLNQVELHPYLQQRALREHHARLGVATQAWAPLGAGNGVLEDPVIVSVARRHRVTPAQVVLRWHLDLGTLAIPKSVTPGRIRENVDVFGFELTDEDYRLVAGLDRGERVGPDPDVLGA